MKKILFLCMAVLGLVFTSCENDELYDGGNYKGDGFRLSYNVSRVVSATTRSTIEVEEGEDQINSFYILFFENTSGGTGQFLEVLDVMSDYQSSLGTTGTLDIDFKESSILSSTGEYKMFLCANIEDYISTVNGLSDLENLCTGKTENEVLAILQMQISGVEPDKTPEEEQTDNTHKMYITKLPMSATAVKMSKDANIAVELVRAVSRFDVYCQANGYELFSASVWNAYTVSHVWETIFTDFSEARTERYYGVPANENKEIVGSLYAFENYVPQPKQSDKETTCLIIGLMNKETNNVEYFRANINASNMGQQLKRNNVYRTTVRNVNVKGADNERDAYQTGELLIDIDINGWTLDDSGNIHYKGDDILALPTSVINLSPYGEVREYNVFTLSEDSNNKLSMTYEFLPEHVKVKLDGNHVRIEAGASTSSFDDGVIHFHFAGMTGSILVTQEADPREYIDLSMYQLPAFMPISGQVSPDIKVTSSGKWIAEIHNGDYFSFGDDETHMFTMEGNPGETFNIQTIKENLTSDSRYCFALVKLESNPQVSRVIVLEQEAFTNQYLYVTPTSFPVISGGGGYTSPITVNASGDWKATLSVNTPYGSAGFVEAVDEDDENDDENASEVEEKVEDEWTRSMGNSFSVRVNPLTVIDLSAVITVTVELVGTDISKTFTINQSPLSQYSLILQTRIATGNGSLYSLNKAASHKYAYQMATNMRNTKLFGPGENAVVKTKGEYIFVVGKDASPLSTIYQVNGSPSSSEIKALKTWWNGGDNRMLLFTNNLSANNSTSRYVKDHFGYTLSIGVGAVAAKEERTFVPNPDMNEPLIKYLLDGPFGQVNANNIKLKSKNGTNRTIRDWPDTFIPILRAGGDKAAYCILGIDPTHRIIWCTDPGIFGSKLNSGLQNAANYNGSNVDNEVFLNNLIAWMTNAAMYGNTFLDDFR